VSGDARFDADAAHRAADVVRRHLGAIDEPALAIVLGSGLGGLAGRIENPAAIAFGDVPGFSAATVAGHAGRLIIGRLAGRSVIALAGRFHMYEGHPTEQAGFPVRVLHALGARTLFVSNAAGGINSEFAPGDLMIVTDHLNLMFRNPLVGTLVAGDTRFPDMSEPYDRALCALLREQGASLGITLREGVYCGLLGPTYETPAEVRMLRVLGADAVGMSTVPEVVVARALGMRVAGVSCITNLASGVSPTPLSHAEVIETTARVATQFETLVERFVAAF
jgi:purine-nucleoside phosphorylase